MGFGFGGKRTQCGCTKWLSVTAVCGSHDKICRLIMWDTCMLRCVQVTEYVCRCVSSCIESSKLFFTTCSASTGRATGGLGIKCCVFMSMCVGVSM